MSEHRPLNPLVKALLTDLYQLTMAYAYWKSGKETDNAVFDLYFRKNPFHGEYTIFAGLGECLKYIESFKFEEDDLNYLRKVMPNCDSSFFDYLGGLDCSEVQVYAMKEGTICFPREPVIRVQGPLIACQLLETTLLNLCNFASLIATNAARFVKAAGPEKQCIEFGLRRAQGPDGGLSASHYAYLGGFHGSSNVLAGKMLGIPISGTHAHAFVQSFSSLDDVKQKTLEGRDLLELALKYRSLLPYGMTNDGELAAFVSYARAFPNSFLALVDTYDTLTSGLPNFIAVALALHEMGHKATGVRLDSGDLAYLSKEARKMFAHAAQKFDAPHLAKATIVASNDINEAVLYSLHDEGHEIDVFGIGTHLVTCQAQPALGMVYKLVELNGSPRIKLSQEIAKTTIPAKKQVYRIFGASERPILDFMTHADQEPPKPGERIFCRHPFIENKRAYVAVSRAEPLQNLVWNGKLVAPSPSLQDIRKYVQEQLALPREDHLRALNPTPYKVSVSAELYDFVHDLWQTETPVKELVE